MPPGDVASGCGGEHIYFEPGEYHPRDDSGFAILAHELTHVLQYRQKGFADFTCQYATHCAFGLHQGCEIEESAYDYQDLALQDRQADSDGVFPPTDNCPQVYNPDQGDSDGDGIGNVCDGNNQSDLLWRHVDGTVAIWHDASPLWTEWPGVLDHYWQIQGVGDFDGDGRSDILWRHFDGTVAIWPAGGPDGTVWPGILDHNWQIQGVGDFSGDGRSDILWRHLDLSMAFWPAGHPDGTVWLETLNHNWQIEGAGKFD